MQGPIIVVLALMWPWPTFHHAVKCEAVMARRAAALLRSCVAVEPAVIGGRSARVSIFVGLMLDSPAPVSDDRVVTVIDRLVKWPRVDVILLPVFLRLRAVTCKDIDKSSCNMLLTHFKTNLINYKQKFQINTN